MNELTTITPELLTPQIVKERICPEATDQEIFLFLQIAKSCKLNPFLSQIYLVKYGGGKAQILTSYNVYLQRAERSGSYAGLETTTSGSVVTGDLKATVKVYRKDWERPLVHEVYFEEYVQKTKEGQPNRFWKEKPRTMITKVAISQAFRLAFPLDFEGMPYTQDEMPQNVDMPLKTIELDKNGEINISKPTQPSKENAALAQLGPIAAIVEPANQAKTPEEVISNLDNKPDERIINEKEGMDLLKMAVKNGYIKKDVTEYIHNLGYKNIKDLTLWDLPTVVKQFEETKEVKEKRKKDLDKEPEGWE